jgi:protein-tyrosine phosphatase
MIKPDVYWIKGPGPGRLAILARPRGADWLEDEVEAWKEIGVDTVVSLLTRSEEVELSLTEESDLVRRSGLRFVNFPIPDYSVPRSQGATRQIVDELRDQLSRGNNVGIHCRQGIGRSSLVAACVLVALGESSGDAFSRIESARGVSVPDTTEQRNWVASFAQNVCEQIL